MESLPADDPEKLAYLIHSRLDEIATAADSYAKHHPTSPSDQIQWNLRLFWNVLGVARELLTDTMSTDNEEETVRSLIESLQRLDDLVQLRSVVVDAFFDTDDPADQRNVERLFLDYLTSSGLYFEREVEAVG